MFSHFYSKPKTFYLYITLTILIMNFFIRYFPYLKNVRIFIKIEYNIKDSTIVTIILAINKSFKYTMPVIKFFSFLKTHYLSLFIK